MLTSRRQVATSGLLALLAGWPDGQVAARRRRVRERAVGGRIAAFLAGAETVTITVGARDGVPLVEVWDGPAFIAEVTRRAVGESW